MTFPALQPVVPVAPRLVRCLAAVVAVAAVAAAVFVPARVARGQGNIENHQVSVVLQFGPYYPAGAWVPLRVELRNYTNQPLDGDVRMTLKSVPLRSSSGEEGARSPQVELRQPVHVPALTRMTAFTYGYFPESNPPPPPGGGAARRSPDEDALTVAELFANGARLARSPVLGNSNMGGDIGGGGGTLLVGLFGKRPHADPVVPIAPGALYPVVSIPDTTYDLTTLSDILEAAGSGLPVSAAPQELVWGPRRRVAYEAARFVVLDEMHPDDLDAAQRRALLDHVTSGGVLILPAPVGPSDPTGSWLDPYLPVRVIGQREASQIVAAADPATGGAAGGGAAAAAAAAAARTYPLATTLPIAEAIEVRPDASGDSAGGAGAPAAAAPRVVLRDEHFVHAAYRPVGLGRIVFTSFPIGAFADDKDERTLALWRTLAAADAPAAADWSVTQLGEPEHRAAILDSMIGIPTAPWSLAAIVAGAYVGIVALLHLAFNGTRRPAAFAVVVVLAVGASAALLGLAGARHRGTQLTGARVATMDLAPTGGGIYRQLTTYLGAENAGFGLRAANPSVTMRPVVSETPVTLTLEPFAAPAAGVHTAKIERVWEATTPLAPDVRVAAAGQFGPDGLRLTVDNPLGAPLDGPVLVWGNVFRVGDGALPPGESTVARLARNARGDYANVAVIASEVDKLRGDILRAVETPARDTLMSRRTAPEPVLSGWLDETAAPQLLVTSPGEPRMHGHVLVRTPVRIDPSPLGSRVRIDGGFSSLEMGQARGLPFDLGKREFIPSTQVGQWLIALAPPAQVGTLRPTRVTLRADAASPAHTVTVRKGQIRDGRPTPSAMSDENVVATWRSPVGMQTATFDVGPGDYDRFGRVWILLSVDLASAGGDNLTPWSFGGLDLSYDDAEVIGPPPSALELQAFAAPPEEEAEEEEQAPQ
jgi:hypothetical protein